MFTGIGFNKLPNQEEYKDYDYCNSITIVLDDIPFTFVEDPQDGYRSSLDRVIIGGQVDTTFDPIPLKLKAVDRLYDKEVEMLIGYDLNWDYESDDNICLEIGTDWVDDYYPSYTSVWRPEKLYINHEGA
mgnify:CR=1 FL=1